jgi:hypothetical protein
LTSKNKNPLYIIKILEANGLSILYRTRIIQTGKTRSNALATKTRASSTANESRFSMRINPDTRVFTPKTKYIVYPKRVTGMRDITDIEFPRYYDRNNPNKQKEDQKNLPTSYKQYLQNDVPVIRNFIKTNEGDKANNINPLSDQEIDLVYKLCQSQLGSVVIDDSFLMQLAVAALSCLLLFRTPWKF